MLGARTDVVGSLLRPPELLEAQRLHSAGKETNQVRVTKPENIELSVSKDGDVYWGTKVVPDMEELVKRLGKESVKNPQPEVHIRGDDKSRYESVGRVIFACQRAGIMKINFVTEPPSRGG